MLVNRVILYHRFSIKINNLYNKYFLSYKIEGIMFLIKTSSFFFFLVVASVQSPSYADTPQAQAANQPLSMDPVLCEF